MVDCTAIRLFGLPRVCIYSCPPNFDISVSSVRQSFATLNTTFYAGWISFISFILELSQVIHCLFFTDSLINFLQVSHKLLDVLVAHKSCTWAYLKNDATLDLWVRKSSFNGLPEARQSVHAEQKYIINSSCFEFIHHI